MYNMGSLNSLAYLDDIVRWNILKCIRYDERFVSGIYLYGELIIFEYIMRRRVQNTVFYIECITSCCGL